MATMDDVIRHTDLVNRVATEYLKGTVDPTALSKQLDLPRVQVVALLNEWRQIAANSDAIRARAREALVGADQHFSSLITKAYEVIDVADANTDLRSKNAAIKLILDIEAKRLEILHRAGLLDNKELADEMAELETKQEILTGILRDVVSKCDTCRPKVMQRMSEATSEAVVFDA